MSTPVTPPTYAEQMAAYDKAMQAWRAEMEKYDRGERPGPPPYPVRPHTPGPSYGASDA